MKNSKGDCLPPAKEANSLLNIDNGVIEYKRFGWFCHNCAQLLSGVYEMHDPERPPDFKECRTCGLSDRFDMHRKLEAMNDLGTWVVI